jgi:hypothetical protein
MTAKTIALLAGAMAAMALAGCASDSNCANGSCSKNSRPLEGNPGATTNQSAGYDSSDPAHYHPQTDDTRQYHPANPPTVQPAGRQ